MIFNTIYNHKELNNKRTCLYNNVKHEQNKYKILNGRAGNANGSWVSFLRCVCVCEFVVAFVFVVVAVDVAVVVLLLLKLFIPSFNMHFL